MIEPDCPSNGALSAFIDGTASPVERAAVLVHLDRCDDCREVVASALQALNAQASAPAPDDPTDSTRRIGLSWRSTWPWALAAAAAAGSVTTCLARVEATFAADVSRTGGDAD